jgi:AcrR family transcriptional regulator
MSRKGEPPGPAGASGRRGAERGRLTREDWIGLGLRLIEAGRAPVDVTLPELCGAAGATKGSFYSHFPGGVEDLHRELLARWAVALRLDQVAADLDAVRSPADRLRLLLERILKAGWGPAAMQRWAAVSPAAAAIVADAGQVFSRLAGQAFTDMGMTDVDGRLIGALLIRAMLGTSPPKADPRQEAETLIELAQRAAATPSAWRLQAVPLEGMSSGLILYQAPADLPAGAQEELAAQVQEFVRARQGDDSRQAERGTA